MVERKLQNDEPDSLSKNQIVVTLFHNYLLQYTDLARVDNKSRPSDDVGSPQVTKLCNYYCDKFAW